MAINRSTSSARRGQRRGAWVLSLVIASTTAIGGCESIAKQCQDSGFTPGTSAYDACVRRHEAERRITGNDALGAHPNP